ncbi:plasmid partitioning protein RepB [Pelagibacterium sp. H642]|uniref:plasmid partitioning protein RepB n=1 Tax=Pelagibacterium sp. H642 TaxID=1881069 RepID=UPI002815BA12|nr:plasmid partitioning protein RepB [Pelagibacterium sp. H642]WMT92532.1 plasmid partitioning protein RepB [Pelagibacterium sp. H642]
MSAKRNSGRSILQNFGAFTQPSTTDAPSSLPSASAGQTPRVGAGVIGATSRSLVELREERDRFKAIAEAGGWLEIDPELIDPSPFPDRLPDDNGTSFAELKELMASEGQKVPIQVRKHPTAEGRFQVVYGHRRRQAAAELGVKVKAIIVAYSDAELVVAQGIENAARQDLSWIERALFVRTMDSAGIKPRDIRAALSVDDPELARLRQVIKMVPVDVIEAIGRAPKVGRPRWLSLANAMSKSSGSAERVLQTLSADKVREQSSDERFKLALAALQKKKVALDSDVELKSPAGVTFGKAAFRGDNVKLSLKGVQGANFGAFLEGELPGLIEKFFAGDGEA